MMKKFGICPFCLMGCTYFSIVYSAPAVEIFYRVINWYFQYFWLEKDQTKIEYSAILNKKPGMSTWLLHKQQVLVAVKGVSCKV